ncbi:hypothetical protein PGTUg99_001382 [Puccinia graminis f. sp. tritici]|uniref:Uncharacterized protein n=1 Tax=Puccinia graminis f. sp. tritici TaxID=56615 RepID=A0A5B0NP61_PUCGR|nr:hypothetical protein PGTUg99_001382 [Puccinia graminis f. sp. tritici]
MLPARGQHIASFARTAGHHYDGFFRGRGGPNDYKRRATPPPFDQVPSFRDSEDNPTSCQPTSNHVSLKINVDTDPLLLPTSDRLPTNDTDRLPTNDTSKCPRPSQAARVVRFLVLAGFIFHNPRRLRGLFHSLFFDALTFLN